MNEISGRRGKRETNERSGESEWINEGSREEKKREMENEGARKRNQKWRRGRRPRLSFLSLLLLSSLSFFLFISYVCGVL
jgi:hypothetical protein